MSTPILDEIMVSARGLVYEMRKTNKNPRKVTVHISKNEKLLLDREITDSFYCIGKDDSGVSGRSTLFGIPLNFEVGNVDEMCISLV